MEYERCVSPGLLLYLLASRQFLGLPRPDCQRGIWAWYCLPYSNLVRVVLVKLLPLTLRPFMNMRLTRAKPIFRSWWCSSLHWKLLVVSLIASQSHKAIDFYVISIALNSFWMLRRALAMGWKNNGGKCIVLFVVVCLQYYVTQFELRHTIWIVLFDDVIQITWHNSNCVTEFKLCHVIFIPYVETAKIFT